jgi:hypothetical protein
MGFWLQRVVGQSPLCRSQEVICKKIDIGCEEDKILFIIVNNISKL